MKTSSIEANARSLSIRMLRACPHIGHARAEALVDQYGDEIIQAILHGYDELARRLLRSTLSERQAQEAFEALRSSASTIALHESLGPYADPSAIERFLRRIPEGERWIDYLMRFPLSSAVRQLPWSARIALWKMLDLDRRDDVAAAILEWTIMEACRSSGDTFISVKSFRRRAVEALGDDAVHRLPGILAHSANIYVSEPMDRVWLTRMREAQAAIAKGLLARRFSIQREDDLCNVVDDVAGHLTEPQRAAVIAAVSHRLSVVSGIAGSGKTTTVAAIVRALQTLEPGSPIILASPTAKAATVLSDRVGLPASTIHVAFKLAPSDDEGVIELESGALERGTVIIDESSMVGEELAGAIFRNVSDQVRLVFVGDEAQLPSVEPGEFFSTLCRFVRERIPQAFASLQQSHRQRQGSRLLDLLNDVAHGRVYSIYDYVGDDVVVESFDDPSKALSFVVDVGMDPDAQIIAPIWGDAQDAAKIGVNHVNREAIRRLFGNASPIVGRRVYLGMRIIWKRNMSLVCRRMARDGRTPEDVHAEMQSWTSSPFDGDEQARRFLNGQTGVVYGSSDFLQMIAIVFDDDPDVVVLFQTEHMLDVIAPAYGITVHSAQGSGYRRVVFLAPPTYYYRELVYTALSRAQSDVIVADLSGGRLWNAPRRKPRKTSLIDALRKFAEGSNERRSS